MCAETDRYITENTPCLLHIFKGQNPPTPRIYAPGGTHLLTEDIDEAAAESVSVHVAGVALDRHQVVTSAAVHFAHRRHR